MVGPFCYNKLMKKQENQFFVICHNIRSTHNVGSIFRTADAVGVDKVYLCGYTPTPPNDKITKVALGAEKTMPWESHTSTMRLIKKLKKDGATIVALENNVKGAMNYLKFKPRFPLALILGNEVGGLPKSILALADRVIALPMKGEKESLNVSVAFGIAAYEINKSKK